METVNRLRCFSPGLASRKGLLLSCCPVFGQASRGARVAQRGGGRLIKRSPKQATVAQEKKQKPVEFFPKSLLVFTSLMIILFT